MSSLLAGKTLKWAQQTHWVDARVHNDIVGENSATYLHRNINSATRQKALLHIGSGDALKVWINDTEIFAKNVQRDAAADQEQLQVQLNPGNNALLLKVVNYFRSFRFLTSALKPDVPLVPADIVEHRGDFPRRT